MTNIISFFNIIKEKKLKNYIYVQYIILIIAVTISGLAMLSGDIIVQIVFIWFLCFTAIAICGFDLLHPYFWYSAGFSLYATAYPILCLMDGTEGSLSPILIPLNWLGLSIFLFVITPKKATQTMNTKIYEMLASVNFSYINIAMVSLAAFIILFLRFNLFSSGAIVKGDIEGGIVASLWSEASIVIMVIYAYKMKTLLTGKTKILSVLITMLICGGAMFAGGSVGERDCYFRFAGVTGYALYASEILKKKHLLLLLPLAVMMLAFSNLFKYYFAYGLPQYRLDNFDFVRSFLEADFYAASKNLQIMVELQVDKLFSPSLIFVDVLPGAFNVSHWFSFIFMRESYGMGFSIIGFGYISFGIIGVVIVMAIVAYIVKALYYQSARNALSFSLYVNASLYCIYANRGTLSVVVMKTLLLVSFVFMINVLLRSKRGDGIKALHIKRFAYGVALYLLLHVPSMILN